MKVRSFEKAGVTLPKRVKHEGTIKILCPQCSHERLKNEEACLSITFNKDGSGKHFGYCHHCKFKFVVVPEGVPDDGNDDRLTYEAPKSYRKCPYVMKDFDLDNDTVDWFASRGISRKTLEACGIASCDYEFTKKRGPEPSAMFPFFKDGELVNIQFRNLGDGKTKEFRAVKDCQKIYYGFDDVVMDGYIASDTLYIVEGPLDKLTMKECGFPFVWSVPNGSPFESEGKEPVREPKLEYHNDPDAQFVISRVSKIVFVGDADHQGRRLVNELASRCGINKCWKVTYPDNCKDINDVLRLYGKEKVTEVIENAHRFPVHGVVRINELRDDIIHLYEQGPDTGLSTGFDNLDEIFRVGKGRVVVITGVPESGKSRFLTNILKNLAELHGVRISMFTPESRPYADFTAKMAQIKTGKPFGRPGDEDRITLKEVLRTVDWLSEYFTFNEAPARTIEELLQIWEGQLLAEGVHYGVLDPFNHIVRPPNVDEGTFALKSLTMMSNWAVKNSFTIFVVVHPRKMEVGKNGEYRTVQPYDIMGSSHWYNCSDFILSLWRSILFDLPVKVHVLKAKQEELGTSRTSCLFRYDRDTGIYTPHYGKEDELFSGERPKGNDDDVRPSGKALRSLARGERQEEFYDEEPRPRRRGRAASILN